MVRTDYAPATVMFSTRIEPQVRPLRTMVSAPTAAMPRNMSLRLPAMVAVPLAAALAHFILEERFNRALLFDLVKRPASPQFVNS